MHRRSVQTLSPNKPTKKKPRFERLRRWTKRIVLGLLIAVVVLYLIGPMIAAPFVRKRLQAMVSSQLNAELRMDGLSYSFPYGVRAKNARLVTKDQYNAEVELVRVREIELRLVELPFGDGPLLIEKIAVRDPVVRLINTDQGLVGERGLMNDVDQGPPAPSTNTPPKPAAKPSDHFRLKRFEIHGGQISMEDRRAKASREPMVWKDINVELNTTQESAAAYAFDLTARNAPIALASVRGKFNIDTLHLDVERYLIAVKASPGAGYNALPPTIQKVLAQNEIDGTLTLGGTAWVPLKEPWKATHDSMLDLPNARGKLHALGGRVDRLALKLRLGNEIPASDRDPEKRGPATQPLRLPPVLARIEIAEISSGPNVIRIEKGRIVIDPELNQWRLRQLVAHLESTDDRAGLPSVLQEFFAKTSITGKVQLTAAANGPLTLQPGKTFRDVTDFEAVAIPRNLSVQLSKWPRPLTNINGIVTAGPKLVSVQNVEANYGADKFYLNSARVPLDALDRQIEVREITGSMNLTGSVEDYPKPLDQIARQIHPMGTWFITGTYAWIKGWSRQDRQQFRADVTSDSAGAGLMATRVPVTDLKTEMTITRDLVDIKRITGWGLGGELIADGKIALGKPTAFEGNIYVRDLDLKALAKALADNGKPPMKLAGKGTVKGSFTAATAHDNQKAEDLVRASGVFEVVEGDFWQVPVMGEVVRGTKTQADALTVGQAAGQFEIKDRRIDLKQVAISAPVLGVQGGGWIGFDRKLDLRVVAAPLADWKDNMKRTKIPIVSDVAGEVLGAFQKMVNGASKTLLYEFKVTGTTKEPRIETVPAPVLTEGIARLFGGMLKGEKLSDIIGRNGQKK